MYSEEDTETFLSAVESNKGIIYKVANSYCNNEEDKKDLIQEIIVQLWLSFDRYDEQYKLSTWMYRIALNASISFYRKEKRREEINHQIPESIIVAAESKETQNTDQNLKRLQQFISELRELDRALILLFLDGYDQKEIADILGLSTTNVSTKTHRIKKKLKQKFSTHNNQ